MAKFKVDTQLFRELGELLVGRESTALVELIKNAYDADARAVIVTGTDLNDPGNGEIIIEDNGTGMTREEFERGFLTIATRMKNKGKKRSPAFGRRFTGEKGIGRLALHKLAKHAEIRSYKYDSERRNWKRKSSFPGNNPGIKATIDWDEIEKAETIDQIDSNALSIKRLNSPKGDARPSGTKLVLNRLRRKWSEKDISDFHFDVATLVPPQALIEPPTKDLIPGGTLIKTPKVRDAKGTPGNTFELQLLGELEYSEQFAGASLREATWVLEIDSDARKKITRYCIQPGKKMIDEFGAVGKEFEVPMSGSEAQISFQSRIFQRSGASWPRRYRGIRVYMEGFRVLPYGEPSDDWLELGYDYTNRANKSLLQKLPGELDEVYPGLKGESAVIQPNAQYFGGVFITRDSAPNLHMVVNREGFLPGPSMDTIRRRVRLGIDMLTRIKYGETITQKRTRNAERKRQIEAVDKADAEEAPSVWRVGEDIQNVDSSVREIKRAVASGDIKTAGRKLNQLHRPLQDLKDSTGELATEQAMFRVLASIGTQLAAFTHEINGLLELSAGLERTLEKLAGADDTPKPLQSKLRATFKSAHSLRQSLERQASYLIDITSIDARRRRSRQSVADRFESACRLLEDAADHRNIELREDIPENFRTPPMFPAEVTAIFTNLLSNAIKFAGDSGRIDTFAKETDNGIAITMENTGTAVQLRSADRWFEPFQSTTTEVDAVLGQGMGLGLTITRAILDEYGAKIRFVKPTKGFKTAIEVSFPDK